VFVADPAVPVDEEIVVDTDDGNIRWKVGEVGEVFRPSGGATVLLFE
jgi:hypothetical protein